MLRNGWLSLAAFLLLMAAILYGGPLLSAYIDKNYRERIKKQGQEINAVVYQKKTNKGNTVHFQYHYKDKPFKNNEQNDVLFNRLKVGDSIRVLVDSTNPSSSYILE